MSRYEAEPWLRHLTAFQRRSVDHVIDQFYGPANADRFLVADETGLGKTMVAQGVIARAIEKLQSKVKRIDVVYVCANSDLARQNIRRLNVTGQGEIPFSSRLTLLGEHSRRLNEARGTDVAVNLVSFTPGTSFDMGHSLGQARERAMIALALISLYDLSRAEKTATFRLLQGGVRTWQGFKSRVESLDRELRDGIDETILDKYGEGLAAATKSEPKSLHDRYSAWLEDVVGRPAIPRELHSETTTLVRDLRRALATASVHTLEPDLIILDEFQRFRHLLSNNNPAGELAPDLFEYEDAKVLLLSATPYKPFTFAGDESEDHAKDLFRTLEFLAKGRNDLKVDDIRSGLRAYREALVDGIAAQDIPRQLRGHLLKLMSRAERPPLPDGSMAVERVTNAADLRAADLADFAATRKVADAVRQPRDQGLVSTEYWKSAPYFLTFADGYQLGRRIREAKTDPKLTELLGASHHIRGSALERFEPLEPGNARMRVLTAETVDQGWWQLLWMPPSISYIEPSGPYAADAARNLTKRLVFSSWTATPSSVASILSYEAERRAVEHSDHYTAYSPDGRKKVARRIQYNADSDGKPRQMAAFLTFWPFPGLARATDPLPWVAEHAGKPLRPSDAVKHATAAVSHRTARRAKGTVDSADQVWHTAFAWDDSWPDATDEQLALALTGNQPQDEDVDADSSGGIPNGLSHHIQAARGAHDQQAAAADNVTIKLLAEVGLYSPANVSYRSLGRLIRGSNEVTEWGHFEAAAILANGLRSLFNRPDAIQLIETLGGDGPYWRKVLRYVSMGNLEAVLDEYLYQLISDRTSGPATDSLLIEIAKEAAAALSLRSPTLRALDASNLDANLAFVARFALRYGGREQDAEDARQPEVRRAFNSPFWPFVLASTSVGQEGIDFHWWCHAVLHWNTPPNPVDFEQREGRVDRYRGHAVRKNVAHKHGVAALSQTATHPWDALYDLATDCRDDLGDFSPGWVYPGPHRIERHIVPFAFSTDLDRYDRMKRDVALYRLTFGQPRQEDMLDVLRRRNIDADLETIKDFRIDLAP